MSDAQGQLSELHTSELNSSRISSEIIAQRGYATVGADMRETLEAMQVPRWAIREDEAFPGLLIPMYRVTGERVGFQFKPAVPQARPGSDKPAKYASPAGSGNRLDVHPAVAELVRDADVPLWVTEGVKKADSLASRGQAVITLTGVWNWRNRKGSLGDWEDVPLRDRAVAVCFDSDALTNQHVKAAFIRFVGWLRSKGANAYYLPVPTEVNGTGVKGVDDYFAAGGDVQGLYACAAKELPKEGPKDAEFTDAYLTDTVCAEALSGRYLWARGLGWMSYDGSRWVESDDAALIEEIRQWAIGHWSDVTEEYKKDQGSDVKGRLEGWRQVLGNARLKALASLVKGPLRAEAGDFDDYPDLLNCPNGVVDLKTGELREHDSTYLFTKVCGVEYEPGARHADFDAALGAVPEDVHGWYQMRMGQAFTGHTPNDDLLIVQQGGGENGKSTLAVPFQRAAGGYFTLVSHRVLLGNPDQHPTETMDLMGARYALMEETPEARRLDVIQLKSIVGTPVIKARRMRQDPIAFKASHTMFVNTNYAPGVAETDHGTWRRLALLKYPYTFRKDAAQVRDRNDKIGDPALRDRCGQDPAVWRAALSWVVEGAKAWYAANKVLPGTPERVQGDTDEWRREGDSLMAFAREHLDLGLDYWVNGAELVQSFNTWQMEQGSKAWSAKTFASRFRDHHIASSNHIEYKAKKINGRTQRVWEGCRLRPGGGGYDMAQEPSPSAPESSQNQDQTTPVTGVTLAPVPPRIATRIEGNRDPRNPRNLAGQPDTASTDDTVCRTPLDLETGSADDLYRSSPSVSFIRLMGVGESAHGIASGGTPYVTHNGHYFDLPALDRHAGLPVEDTIPLSRDLRVAAFQHDPPTTYETTPGPGFKSYSLDALGERYLNVPKSTAGKELAAEFGGWDNIPADDPRYAEYCVADLELTKRLDDAIPYDPYEKREAAVSAVTARASLSGMAVDVEGLQARAQSLAQRAEEGRAMLAETYGFPLTNKSGKPASAPQRTAGGKEAFRAALEDLGYPVQYWPTGKDGSLSLGKDVMAQAAEWAREKGHPALPVIEAVQMMNGIRNNAANVLRWVGTDGRVHPLFLPFQSTGRWSVQDPGLTVLKKGVADSERAFLLPDDGDVLVSIDLDQVDIRCVAAHSQDPALLAILNDPARDIHQEIADLAGVPRKDAKTLDLGWLYGRTVNGLAKTPGMTHEVAERVDGSMRERFPVVMQWQRQVREMGEAGVLLNNGFGRRLRVDPQRAFTQAPALMGQSTTRDLIAEGLIDLARTAPEVLPMLRVIVHDEVVASVPRESAEEVARILQSALSRQWAPEGKSLPVNVTAGQGKPFTFGENWAELYL